MSTTIKKSHKWLYDCLTKQNHFSNGYVCDRVSSKPVPRVCNMIPNHRLATKLHQFDTRPDLLCISSSMCLLNLGSLIMLTF